MSKYDSAGREVLGADWNALQDIPALVAALGNLTTSAGGIIIATSSSALSTLSAGTFGQVLAINGSGAPAWTSTSGGVGSSSASVLTSDVGLSGSVATVGSVILPAAGTYYIQTMLGIVMGSTAANGAFAYNISAGTALLPGLQAGQCQVINNLNTIENYFGSILNISGVGLYASDNNTVNGQGVITVTSNCTLNLTLQLSAFSGTAKSGSVIQALRVA